MFKVLIKTIVGLILTLGGFYFIYLYMFSLNGNQGGNLLLLIPAGLCVPVGIFFLVRAGKADDSVIAKPKASAQVQQTAGLEDRLKMNNEITSEWNKTNDDKNRLRLLEISAAEES